MTPSEFLTAGIAVVPILPRTKRPMVRWQRYQSQLPTQAEFRRWFRPGRQMNAAAICGWQGLTVLDFDTTQSYITWQSWAIGNSSSARNVALGTYQVRTSRGIHLYLFVDQTPRCGKSQFCDIKARGGYVLIPPSVHPSGVIYTAVDNAAPIMRVADLSEVLPDPPAPPGPVINPPVHVYQASSLWPLSVIDQIKMSHGILEFFPGARPTGANGRWQMTRCPFHDDQHESMRLDTQHNLAYCFAGCTPKPLDVIALYARLNGLTNKEAIKALVRR